MNKMLDFQLFFDSDQLRPAEVEKAILSFEKEMVQLEGVKKASGRQVEGDIDPLLFAALGFSLAPAVTPKFLEFLNAWVMRRENRVIKVKVQLGWNQSIEIDGSETLSQKKMEDWISAIEKSRQHN